MRTSAASRAIVTAIVVLVALNLVVFGLRLASVIEAFRYYPTEGAESTNPYAIWRLLEGLPLYLTATDPPYTVTFYNFGFYYFYAAVLRLFSVDGESILLGARLITLGLGLLGAWVTYRILVYLVGTAAVGRVRALLALASVVMWIGTNFVAWWALSIRPDIGACLFSMSALAVFLRVGAGRSWQLAIVAGALFALAWSFKQSAILVFVGSMLYALLVLRSVKITAALGAPVVLAVALALLVGGSVYRQNIVEMPALSGWHLRDMVAIFGRVFVQNALLWCLFPAVLLGLVWKRRGLGLRWPQPSRDMQLAVVLLVAVPLGIFALGREGSNKNHLLEAYMVVGIGSIWKVVSLMTRAEQQRDTRISWSIFAALLPMVVFPLAQLVLWNKVGRIWLASSAELTSRAQLSAWLADLPKPFYVEDEVFSQPWHSTVAGRPAVVLDYAWFAIAQRRRVIPEGAILGLAGTHVRTFVFGEGDRRVAAALSSGMQCRPFDSGPGGPRLQACQVR